MQLSQGSFEETQMGKQNIRSRSKLPGLFLQFSKFTQMIKNKLRTRLLKNALPLSCNIINVPDASTISASNNCIVPVAEVDCTPSTSTARILADGSNNIGENVVANEECMKLLEDFELLTSADSPRKVRLKNDLRATRKQKDRYVKMIRSKRNKCYRLKKKVFELKSVIAELEEKLLINKDIANILENSTDNVKALHKRMATKEKHAKYSPELRTFAITLNFYSPKAYKYVRSNFSNCLPHPKQLQKWYQSVSGAPGFSKDALSVMGQMAQDSAIPRCLLIDEMAIRQHVQYQAGKLY